ncbi:hypothetical protein PR048_024665 [Dryococelus australis]|uniref:Uncharacterized protein n=1 Tax=Dryococelus australis TaxID=614101 RepID=A0ABQ9GP76_9NEOP|nr:hypothetical protein PR048_024665 [Dryococelus australis]
MCCFRDNKNFERFNLVTQSIISLAICQLRDLKEELLKAKPASRDDAEVDAADKNKENNSGTKENLSSREVTVDVVGDADKTGDSKDEEDTCSKKESKDSSEDSKDQNEKSDIDEESWNIEEKEKLIHFLAKIFLLNFPLYVAYKHGMQSKMEDMTQQEASSLNMFCDLHDPEIPVYLLRNVCLFCKAGGVHAMTSCFDLQSPDLLPVPIAHAIIAVVCNLKLWLNLRSIMQLFVPLRAKVLRYMCCLADKDLRTPGIKSMAGKGTCSSVPYVHDVHVSYL